jgi:excinuclease ABC subunit A
MLDLSAHACETATAVTDSNSPDPESVVFENVPSLLKKIQKANRFGLGYLRLGQSFASLSGGEMQRFHLVLELKKSQNLENHWFILEHPSTGLHDPDIIILGELMRELTKSGATLVVMENREDFCSFADHVIPF